MSDWQQIAVANQVVAVQLAKPGDEGLLNGLLQDQQTLIDSQLRLPDRTDQFSWQWSLSALVASGRLLLIISQEIKRPVGIITLEERGKSVVAIGYLLAPAFRGRGLMTSAIRLLLGTLHRHWPQVVVQAETLAGNRASIGVLRRAGFQQLTRCAADGSYCWQWPPEKS